MTQPAAFFSVLPDGGKLPQNDVPVALKSRVLMLAYSQFADRND